MNSDTVIRLNAGGFTQLFLTVFKVKIHKIVLLGAMITFNIHFPPMKLLIFTTVAPRYPHNEYAFHALHFNSVEEEKKRSSLADKHLGCGRERIYLVKRVASNTDVSYSSPQ